MSDNVSQSLPWSGTVHTCQGGKRIPERQVHQVRFRIPVIAFETSHPGTREMRQLTVSGVCRGNALIHPFPETTLQK